MKVAILGARKFGAFHVREFRDAGCDVIAILGSTAETANLAAEKLQDKYGIHARPYHQLDMLLTEDYPDAVSVCVPPNLHEQFSYRCLEMGAHVLCEKPLNPSPGARDVADRLLGLAQKRGKIFAVGTQWPSVLEYLPSVNLTHLTVNMEPGQKGLGLVSDHLPHTNSLLVRMLPGGSAREIAVYTQSEEYVKLGFAYVSNERSCAVDYTFSYKAERPRKVEFSINGVQYRREVSPTYQQSIVSNGSTFDIIDPLKVSITRFTEACQGRGTPLVSPQEIRENCSLQDAILAYVSVR